jgi:hypothetical protein
MKTSRVLAAIVVIVFFTLKFDVFANVLAQPNPALSVTLNYQSQVYLGDSFVWQASIFNNGNVSHNYVLSWTVDNASLINPPPTFNSSGTIQSYETVTLTPSFVFAQQGSHYIMLRLYQDGMWVEDLTIAVTVVSALSIIMNCPSKVYLGDSFAFQASIFNNGNVSHNYVLSWIVDNISLNNPTPTFNSSGTIQSYETVTLTPSFVFARQGSHYMMLRLYQDGSLVYASNLDTAFTVEVIKVDTALLYQINPNPIYPNSSFSINLMITNVGDELINYTKIKSISVVQHSMIDKIVLQTTLGADLGMIPPSAVKNSTFSFDVTYDTPPGVYPMRVQLTFSDLSDNTYEKAYYVPLEVCSGEIVDRFSILESNVENELDKFRYNLGVLQQSMTVIAVLLLALTLALAATNFWYTRRTASTRRKL